MLLCFVTGETLLLVTERAPSWVQHISRADSGLPSGASSSSQVLIVLPLVLAAGTVEVYVQLLFETLVGITKYVTSIICFLIVKGTDKLLILAEFMASAYWYWILQNELEGVSGDDTAMSPGPQSAQQQQQAVAVAAGSVGNSVFTGTLASPIRRDLPAFSMTPSGCGLTNNSGHPGRRTGVGLEQHANLGWEEDQGVALYHDASATGGLGFHPTQQQQQGGDGHSFGVNDASMDMHGGGVGDGYFH